MTELIALTETVKALEEKLAMLTELVEAHITMTTPDKVKPAVSDPKPAVEPTSYIEELNKLWSLYRAERDPAKKRELYAQIKALEAKVNKVPGSGVVRPR